MFLVRKLPDLLTLARLIASPLLAWLIVESRFREALALVIFAGLTDWFDGYAARLLNTGGKLGVVLDPLADKMLLVTLFLALAAVGLIARWLLLLVVLRDLVIVGGALLLRHYRNIRQFLPLWLGKVSTFFQIVFVLLVLLSAAFPLELLFILRAAAFVLTALFTTLSGIHYVRLGIRLARQPRVPHAEPIF